MERDGYIVTWNYRVRVLRNYRGPSARQLTIRTENDSGRFLMQKKQTYLLFARMYEGSLRIDNCGNSVELSEAADAIEAIRRIAGAGLYGDIEISLAPAGSDLSGVQFVASCGNRTFSGTTNTEGRARIRVPPGVCRVSARSRRLSLTPFDLNEDRPDHLLVHRGGSVQLDFKASPK